MDIGRAGIEDTYFGEETVAWFIDFLLALLCLRADMVFKFGALRTDRVFVDVGGNRVFSPPRRSGAAGAFENADIA